MTLTKVSPRMVEGTGTVSVLSFDAVADMTYTEDGVNGPTLTAGTNNLTAFKAADAYAFTNNLCVVVPNGQYYIEGEFSPTAKWKAASDFGATIWSKISVYEIGINLKQTDAQWGCEDGGFKMIGQYDRAGVSKPANAGQLGNIVAMGTFLSGSAQTPMERMSVRVLMRRAKDTASQNSDGAFFSNTMGYCVEYKWQVGVWGDGSNVTSNTGLIQSHWGGLLDDGGAWDITQDPTAYDVLTSYHPENGNIEFINGTIDASAHGLAQVWTRSATINVHMGACSSTGAHRPIYELAGDENGTYAVSAQAGKVGLNNTTGLQKHTEVDPAGLSASEGYTSFDRGTSKTYTAPGGVARQDQYRHSVTGEGLILETGSGTQILRRLLGSPDASFDLGPLYLNATSTDVEKAIYYQACSGGVIDLRQSNRAVHVDWSYLEKLTVNTDLGPLKNVSPNGDFQLGYDSNNAGLVVESARYTTTISANISDGDTSISVAALPVGVPKGTKLFVGGKPLVTTRYASEAGTEIEVKPSPYAVTSGASVAIELIAEIDELISEISSSEFGIMMRGGKINKADLTGMNGQGRYAAYLDTHDGGDGPTSIPSVLRVVGGSMPIIGRIGSFSGTPTGYTIRIQPRCRAIIKDVDIPANPDIVAHVQAVRVGASGEWGSVHFDGCRIEDPTTLVSATVLAESVSLTNCVDYEGAPVTISDL